MVSCLCFGFTLIFGEKQLPVTQPYGDRHLLKRSWEEGGHNKVVSVRTLFLLDSLQIRPFHYIRHSSKYPTGVLACSVLEGSSRGQRCPQASGDHGPAFLLLLQPRPAAAGRYRQGPACCYGSLFCHVGHPDQLVPGTP